MFSLFRTFFVFFFVLILFIFLFVLILFIAPSESDTFGEWAYVEETENYGAVFSVSRSWILFKTKLCVFTCCSACSGIFFTTCGCESIAGGMCQIRKITYSRKTTVCSFAF
jgi:hypothetical protein